MFQFQHYRQGVYTIYMYDAAVSDIVYTAFVSTHNASLQLAYFQCHFLFPFIEQNPASEGIRQYPRR